MQHDAIISGSDGSVLTVGSHGMNLLILMAPVLAWLTKLPMIISSLVGLCALFYYYLVIGRELAARRERKAAEKVHAPLD